MTPKSSTKLGLAIGIIVGLILGASVTYVVKSGVSQDQHNKVVGELGAAMRELNTTKQTLNTTKQTNTQLENLLAGTKQENDALKKENAQMANQISALREQLANKTNPQPINGTKPISRLHVEGNKLINEDGNVVILRGVSVLDLSHSPERYPYLFEKDYNEIKNNLKANAVRVPVHPRQWQLRKNDIIKWLDAQVKMTKERNLYIIICYHAIGNPIQPDPNIEQNPDLKIALDFLGNVTKRYTDQKHVIYEIFNEPAMPTWDDWKPYAQQLVDLVRSNDPNAIILVGGVDFAGDLRGVVKNPIKGHNIGYSFHPYPIKAALERANRNPNGSPEVWELRYGETADNFFTFATELGFEDINLPNDWATRIYGADARYGRGIIDWLESRGISWCAWHFSNLYGPALLKNMYDYSLTESGEFFKQEMIKLNSGQ